MVAFRIDFEAIDWQSLLPGARAKVHREGAKQIRLVEFTSEFVEPQWCEKGHIGFVVSGTLEIDFRGEVITYPEGSGILIPPGSSSAHKARSVTPAVQLFLVEDA